MVYWWRRHWLIWNWQLLPSCASSGVFFLFLSSRGGELFIIRGIKIRYLWINKYKKKTRRHTGRTLENVTKCDGTQLALFSSHRTIEEWQFFRGAFLRIESWIVLRRRCTIFQYFPPFRRPPSFRRKSPSREQFLGEGPTKKKKIENRLKIFPSWGRKKTFGCSLLRQHPSPERRVTMATSLMVTCCERPL